MSYQGKKVDCGEACTTATSEQGGGQYFAQVYYVNRAGSLALGRAKMHHRPVDEIVGAVMTAKEALERRNKANVPIGNIVSVVFQRLCWNEVHEGAPQVTSRDHRLERVSSVVIANHRGAIVDASNIEVAQDPDHEGFAVVYDGRGAKDPQTGLFLSVTTTEVDKCPVKRYVGTSLPADPTTAPYVALHENPGNPDDCLETIALRRWFE